MRILIIQENGRHDKNRSFRECFCAQRALATYGIQCDVWGKGHENFPIAIDFNSYDFILDLENYDSGWVPDLSSVKAYKMMWVIDGHCRGMKPYLLRFNRGKYDLILQASKELVDSNSVWFPNCFDDSIIGPRNVDKRADIGFCGNVLNRGSYLETLAEHFKFAKDVFVIGEDMVKAINSYKIHFNANISFDINYRNFETIGCGIPLITNYNQWYEELGFKHGYNCMTYVDKEDLIMNIKFALNNQEYLKQIADNGLELSQKHTYRFRMKYLLDILENATSR